MDLIIVESPTKARTLSRFLGDGFDVEATMGHVKDLPKSTLGVDTAKNFTPELVDVVKRKDTITTLKRKAKKADKIYLASDPDREGEAIAEHVRQILVEKGAQDIEARISRVTFHEITKEAVEAALNNPHKINENLVDAQTARRVLDRLVGYKLSPLLWKKVRRGLSAGRVQSVAVKLIVEREREISAFKNEEYWEIFVEMEAGPAGSSSRPTSSENKFPAGARRDALRFRHPRMFTVQLVKIENKKAEVKNKKEADVIIKDLNTADYKVADVKKREVNKIPYPPFTTSTMQQAGSRVLGWSSKKTMSVAQKLYEEGYITYHRTDSLNLSATAVEKARELIKKEYGAEYITPKPRFYKVKSKTAQEAHEAIRPTDVGFKLQATDDKWGKDEVRLYDLIWRRFIACQMSSSVFAETTIEVSAGKYLLRASGQIMKFDGWRRVIPLKSTGEEEIASLPDVDPGEALDFMKVWGDQKFTQPPARYNEASLIKMLEKLGIGRPSTYAPTISTIQVRAYVDKNESKQFVPTSVGVAVTDFLTGNFDGIMDYKFTADMESDLDAIANGEHPWEKTIKNFYKPFEVKVKDVEKNSKRVKIEVEKLGQKCPDCEEGELVIRTGRFGKFISCSRFPDCKHTAKYLEKVGVTCPECKEGEVIVKKTGKGRKFFGCSRYPDCKFASWRNPKSKKET